MPTPITEEELPKGENTLIHIYLTLFATSHNPQASSEEILKTIGKISADAVKNEQVIQASKEVARTAGGELHNTSALTGGMVAQEMIKIITKQYIPVENTCIYDGVTSTIMTLRL